MNTTSDSSHYVPNAGDYLIASKSCELMSLQYFLRMGKMIQCISNLVHGLQRERGASNVFLGSAGTRFGVERRELLEEADRLKQAFEQALAEIHEELTGDPVSSRLLNQIAIGLHDLEGLDELRAGVAALSITADCATESYSTLIKNLIAIVFEAADTAVDPTIAGLLVAMVHLMNGKEFCGQERAVGSTGFSSGSFNTAQSQRMMHLVEAQERCFQVFTSFADNDSLALWRDVSEHDRERSIKQLRELASSVGRYKSLDPELADQWFALMTDRIDALKAVEDSVEGCFHARCAERYADARESLSHQETLISSLEEEDKSPGQPVLLLCDSGEDEETAGSFASGGVSQQFGRSIFELVQQQSVRLQQMNDELQSAREALADRKLHEKAVLVLMNHRNISNDEAHRVLRKLAMDQGKKLSEVASSVIAMEEVLKRR
ncbi:nitrate regulatory protein [Marinobacter sp. CHS3-4]|uniref:nitrate regulatory protein n=1 Tax=Marinobacter sp. CHS3-4 TaxID=3045174 RepID=UPI0024B5498B|nr:nitrate regulatory protein [Marinobacter sp. CHS3-4]MDI9243645.1 nitrate- and nitrite sensing domain-containing protein [Marinobacter sp. CHS3-4]